MYKLSQELKDYIDKQVLMKRAQRDHNYDLLCELSFMKDDIDIPELHISLQDCFEDVSLYYKMQRDIIYARDCYIKAKCKASGLNDLYMKSIKDSFNYL